MDRDKTVAHISRWGFWPGLGEDVARHCIACPEYQKVREDHPAWTPLQPLPVIDESFSRIALDVIRPLPRNSAGHQYILVFIDYVTWYPEVVPLWAVKYSPFELVLGHCPHSLLQALREDWELSTGGAKDPTLYRQKFQK